MLGFLLNCRFELAVPFNSHREESEFGLYDYKARYYSPLLGCFISADSIVPDFSNPQALNRYAYVYNNPLKFTDPSGHFPWLVPILVGIALIPSDVQPVQRGVCPYHDCGSLDRYNTTINYMHGEMVQNAQSTTVGYIQSVDGVTKNAVWGAMVAPNSVWDHKPKLRDMLGLYQEQQDFYFPIEGDTEYEYFYDIWSNIHYGYVGMAAGFEAETLQAGAAVAGWAGRNDEYDVLSIQIGIDLWEEYGLALTSEQVRDAILANRDEYRRIWEEVYDSDEDFYTPLISQEKKEGGNKR